MSTGCSGCAKLAKDQIGYIMQINTLNAAKNALQSSQNDLTQENQELLKHNEELESKVRELTVLKETLQANLVSAHQKLTEARNELKTTILEKTEKIEDLTQENEGMNMQLLNLKGKEKILEQEKKNLQEKADLLTKKQEEYLDKVNKLTEKTRSLENMQELKKKEGLLAQNEQEKLKIKGELDEKIQENKDLEEEMAEYQKKLKTAEDRVEKLKNELRGYKKSLAKYLKEPRENIEEYISLFIHKHEALQEEYNSLQKEKQDIKKEYEKVEEKYGNVKDEKVLYQYKEIRTDKDHTFKSYYDCRVLADSFFPILQDKSWVIEFNNWENYKKRIQESSVRVSVLGYENTGKSFMIGQIMGHNVPQGKQMKTTGICVLYPEDPSIPWTALDTPGTNISIRTEFMKDELEGYFEEREKILGKKISSEHKLRMLYGDNILMEQLLQEFVVNHTQVLLILVGKMRRDDQRFINRIKNQKECAVKRIIIVHNLMDCVTLKDVEDIIKEDIEDTFGAKKRIINLHESSNKYVYLEKDKKGTEHVVLAHQDSPAGKFYNEVAIQYIKSVVATSPFSEKFDFVKAFQEYLNHNIKNYLSESGASSQVIKRSFIVENDETEDKEEQMPLSFKLQQSKLFDLKLNITDEFGHIRTYTEGALETVPYVVKTVKRENGKGEEERYLQVEFEVSGTCNNMNIKTNVQVNNNLWVIRIKGMSEDNNQREEGEDIMQTTRKFGEFLITTNPIDLNGYTIFRGEKPSVTSEVPGLKTVSFKLYSLQFAEDF